jgi:hypothetical protein
MARELNAAEVYFTSSPIGLGISFCSEQAVNDTERREECDQLAQLLLKNGKTMIEAMVGRIVGQIVGWSPERVAAVDAERGALLLLPADDPGGVWDCRRAAAWNVMLKGQASGGERAAYRELARRLGN